MQREIKFRAWDNGNSRMVYEPYRFVPCYSGDEDNQDNLPFYFYEEWTDEEDGIKRYCQLMQYTGLKDKNGKEIYEGDIQRHEHKLNKLLGGGYSNVGYSYGVVEFKVGRFVTVAKKFDSSISKYFGENGIYKFPEEGPAKGEVIGNIYENPELCPE